MTAPDLAAALIEDVPIGYWVKRADVLAALSRALDPAIAERAGEVVKRLTDEHVAASRTEAADLITALLTANAALRAERDVLRHKLQAMHRRAQRVEGKSHRTAHLLETILRSVKDAMKPDTQISMHTLYSRIHAARDHARASSGRAWSEGFHYLWPQLKAAEAQIATLTAQVERLTGAITFALSEYDAPNDIHEAMSKLRTELSKDAALTAALDPAIAERAGGVLEALRSKTPNMTKGHAAMEAGADLITALLAQIAALRAERDALVAEVKQADAMLVAEANASLERLARAEAAETEVEKLRDAMRSIEHLTDNDRIRGIARAALTTEADNG